MHRHRLLACSPRKELLVGRLKKALEVIKVLFAHGLYVVVSVSTEKQIHFSHPAMPGADEYPLAAGIHLMGGQFRSGHAHVLDREGICMRYSAVAHEEKPQRRYPVCVPAF